MGITHQTALAGFSGIVGVVAVATTPDESWHALIGAEATREAAFHRRVGSVLPKRRVVIEQNSVHDGA
jgi:hypothetical protein